ncbi:hypothetical protein LTR91_025152 [Friedmanniomyces endolithicus]|uniref:Uncharacterized protein n=1 Tax=Friedmanniomyces endolithicus TaxID=329885 RepID=A0A4U0UWC8_9PEZI|nr:hypothetical protein LTS09_017594 [Friedmanniomyces endolithicus]KAK0266713.1 hypothetical protein LTR35_016873 [Friedmanniomyces endolithicus]KAK0273173.1 hypothetical protein LTS00_015927 [Friedmanniomyces endolithicus]KAK0303143.1 hypothetical protein LTR01_008289 [Friedmanniomyces endolithicus]KAK0307785.1 hypothetical protein LTR82_015822 [Friedmanniomyces endolithicus]
MCIYDATHYACTAEDMVLVQQCPCLPDCLPHIRLTLFRTAVCHLCAIAGLEEGARIVSAAGRREGEDCTGGAGGGGLTGRPGTGVPGGVAGVSGVGLHGCVDGSAEEDFRPEVGRAERFEPPAHAGDAVMPESTSVHGDDRQDGDIDEENNVDAM